MMNPRANSSRSSLPRYLNMSSWSSRKYRKKSAAILSSGDSAALCRLHNTREAIALRPMVFWRSAFVCQAAPSTMTTFPSWETISSRSSVMKCSRVSSWSQSLLLRA